MIKTNNNIQKLNYGIIHSQFGFEDGVSIVMKQVDEVLRKYLHIPKSKIHYLVGKSKKIDKYIRQRRILWHKNKTNLLLNYYFNKGFGGALSEKIENAIWNAKAEIKKFVYENKINVLIVHNSSHPVNFISSIALSRFYRDEYKRGKKPPRYILWWHDSHLERKRYQNPSNDIKNYLLEGVPGKYVNYIIFINRLQFETAQKYIKDLDSRSPGLYENLFKNNTVVYNTATTYINTFKELEKEEYTERVEYFLKEFKNLFQRNGLMLKDVIFCLQHTRVIPRKKIDFALRYAYEVFNNIKNKKDIKSMVFLVSGPSGDESGDYKKELITLNKELSKQYNTDKFFLIFAEDFKKIKISFEEIPIIIARLGGFATYFSEEEGFGNNLLEVLAAGLIPAVYTYPVYLKDISNYNFNIVKTDKLEIDQKSIRGMIRLILNDNLKREWANKNIQILKKNFSNKTIAPRLRKAILSKK